MKRLIALIVVAAVGVVFSATPVSAAKPDPKVLSVTSELGLNCTVEATAQVEDMRGRYFVYFVVNGDRAGQTNQLLAWADVPVSRHDTTVVAQLPMTTGDWGKNVLAYLHDGPIDGRWATVGFALESVNYPCGL
jgi:hypothetical protein